MRVEKLPLLLQAALRASWESADAARLAAAMRASLAHASHACAALLLLLVVAGSLYRLWSETHTWQQYR